MIARRHKKGLKRAWVRKKKDCWSPPATEKSLILSKINPDDRVMESPAGKATTRSKNTK